MGELRGGEGIGGGREERNRVNVRGTEWREGAKRGHEQEREGAVVYV